MYYIYLIINNLTGKKYIGQRKVTFGKHPLDDLYWGSCKDLKNDIIKYGKKYFSKVILDICETKEEIEKAEAKYLKLNNVRSRQDFYNKGLATHSNVNPEKHTKDHAQFLEAKLKTQIELNDKIYFLKKKLKNLGMNRKLNLNQVIMLIGEDQKNTNSYFNIIYSEFTEWKDVRLDIQIDILGDKSINALTDLGFFDELNN